MRRGPSTRPARWMVAALLLLAVLMRLPGLSKGFASDEFGTVMVASGPLAGIPSTLVREDFHPPLYHLALGVWMRAGDAIGGVAGRPFGAEEVWVRLLSVFCGVAICWLMWRLGVLLAGERFALWLLAAGALLPQGIWMSQYTRGYAFASVWLLVAVEQAIHLLRGNGLRGNGAEARRRWFWLIAAELASLYSFYYSGLVLFALNVPLLLMMSARGRGMAWAGSQFAVALGYWPWVSALASQFGQRSDHPIVVAQTGFYLGSLHLGGLARGALGLVGADELLFAGAVGSLWGRAALLASAATAVLLAGAGLVCGWRALGRVLKHPEERWVLAALIAGPFLGAMIMHHQWHVVVMARYFAPTACFTAVALVAWGLTIGHPVARGALVVCCAALCVWRAGAMYAWREVDFKGASQYVSEYVAGLTAAEGAGVVVASIEPGRFEYYCGQLPVKRLVLTDAELAAGAEGAGGAADVADAADEGPLIIWLKQEKLQHRQMNDKAEAWLSRGGYRAVGRQSFGLLQAITYERERPGTARRPLQDDCHMASRRTT